MATGTIFAVQRFSVHDGPGIRTTVFLKGCPLRCAWCQNPEGLDEGVRLWLFANLCSGCGRCIAACPHSALAMGENGVPVIDHAACTRCGACVDACNHNALAMNGRVVSSEGLIRELLEDRLFFSVTGGGVTFSGGEPLAQADFVAEVAAGIKAAGFATAMETSMFGEWRALEKCLPVIDFFQVDLKLADPERHARAVGRDNARILDNFRRLAKSVAADRLLIRVPLVPGFTADAANLRAIGELAAGLAPGVRVELLNFNPLAEAKYRRMPGLDYALAGAKAFSEEEMRAFRREAAECVEIV